MDKPLIIWPSPSAGTDLLLPESQQLTVASDGHGLRAPPLNAGTQSGGLPGHSFLPWQAPLLQQVLRRLMPLTVSLSNRKTHSDDDLGSDQGCPDLTRRSRGATTADDSPRQPAQHCRPSCAW